MLSANNELQQWEDELGILTGSKELDDLFNGNGIPVGAVTEICGMAGLGKTQICMQLCANVKLGVGRRDCTCIYIDCEGSFVASRMKQIAQASTLFQTGAANSEGQVVEPLTTTDIMSSIKIVRPENQQDFIDKVMAIEQMLTSLNGTCKLVVIDSIAFYFRSFSYGDFAERTRILSTLAQTVRKAANVHQIAIVVTNQMTTRIKNGANLMTPALGDSWSHACTHRIILLWYNKARTAWLCKSATQEDKMKEYNITSNGIRDIDPS